jgi:hypothetical protein
LISIHPFSPRKILLAIVAFLCFSALCFADPVLMVRRYSRAERLAIPRVLISTGQESAGDGQAGIVDPCFAHVESADLAASQFGSASNDGGKMGLRPGVASSLFRHASCAMRSSGASAAIHNGGTLPRQDLAAL